jgi:signal transduction histidine kinase
VALLLAWAPRGFCFLGYTETYTAISWRYWRLLDFLRQFTSTVGMSALVLLFLIFPDGRFAPSWMKWTLAPLALMVAVSIIGLEALAWTGVTWEVLMIGLVLLLTVAAAAQVYRYRRIATPAQRQQTRAVVLVLALLPVWLIIALLLQRLAAPAWRSLVSIVQLHLSMLVPLAIPLTLGYAALRHQLWDVAPIVRRTLVYTLLSLCVTGIYVLVVGAAASLLRIDNNLLLTVLVTGAVAMLALPLRQRLQGLVNRFLYGERDAPATVLARLADRLEATGTADQVLPAIATTVGQALKLPYVAVTTRSDDTWTPAAIYQAQPQRNGGPDAWPGLVKTPLYYQREQIGELWAAPRSARERLTPADLALIEQVAQHAGPALHAAALAADLQRSREQIVLAGEEERRRLHRDLHDGLGPQLAGLVLRIDAARNWLQRDPTKAEELLIELRQQVQGATNDVRRIVYDLRPAALDQLGLVGAIRHYAQRAGGEQLQIEVAAPEVLPPLDAAVEVAAYRIILEAVANVVRHAGARHCYVNLSLDGALVLEIADDGRGLPPLMQAGMGLRSMRERAAVLGGALLIEPRPGGGVCVRVRLPLAPHDKGARI